MSPRKRITLALVALVLLVVVGWFVRGAGAPTEHDSLGAESEPAVRTLYEVPSDFTESYDHRGHVGTARGERDAVIDADG